MPGNKVTITFSDKILEKLDEMANEMGVTRTVVVSLAINEYYDKIKNKEGEKRIVGE